MLVNLTQLVQLRQQSTQCCAQLHKCANLTNVNNTDVLTDLCSVVDAAEILGKPVSTVQKWARSGRIPVVGKLSGRQGAYILDRTEMNYLAAQRNKARK